MAGLGNNVSVGSSSDGDFDEQSRITPLSKIQRDAVNKHQFKDEGTPFLTEQTSLDNARKRAFPSRLRGEELAQEIRKTYTFFDYELPANLFALHDERTILVQFDVSVGLAQRGFEPPLSRSRIDMANRLMKDLEKNLNGFIPKLERLITHKAKEVDFEGPFMAAGESAVSLSMRISRSANYDEVYERVQNFLEFNDYNDKRSELAYKPNAMFDELRLPMPSVFPYVWSAEELDYAEEMPPEELLNLKDPNGNIIPPEFFMKGNRPVDYNEYINPDPSKKEAAIAAQDALRSAARRR